MAGGFGIPRRDFGVGASFRDPSAQARIAYPTLVTLWRNSEEVKIRMTTRTFVEFDAKTARKVQMASAACMLTSDEFVALAVDSALAAAASKNKSLAAVLEYASL